MNMALVVWINSIGIIGQLFGLIPDMPSQSVLPILAKEYRLAVLLWLIVQLYD